MWKRNLFFNIEVSNRHPSKVGDGVGVRSRYIDEELLARSEYLVADNEMPKSIRNREIIGF